MVNPPKKKILSIITPIHRKAEFFLDAIASMPGCNEEIEWLIIHDGFEIENDLRELYQLPEYATPIKGDEQGPTAAVNKGLSKSCGTYCLFLMSDDLIVKNGLLQLIEVLQTEEEHEIISLGLDFFSHNEETPLFRNLPAPRLTLEQILYGRPCLCGRVYKKDIFKRVGIFDNTFTKCADREFFVRLYFCKFATKSIDIGLYRHRVHCQSETMGKSRRRIIQFLEVHLKIIEKFLNSSSASPKIKKTFLQWKDYENFRLAYYLFLSGSLFKSAKIISKEISIFPRFLMSVICSRAIVRRINRIDTTLGP